MDKESTSAGESPAHPFSRLDPSRVLDAVDSVGLHGDGRLLALNSYENRVYQFIADDNRRYVVKFYRPGRWTTDQIIEEHDAPAEWVVDTTLALFDDGDVETDAPWYVHAHFLDPHTPFDPPEAYLDGLDALPPILYDLTNFSWYQQLNEDWETLDEAEQAVILEHLWLRYYGELAYVDAQVGRLLAELESRGMLEHTLVVFWTDHGEQFLERGSLGHGRELHEEENRSIAIYSAPGLTPGVWTGPTTHADVWPTALEALDIARPSAWTGLPVGQRADDTARFASWHGMETPRQMVERGDSKLLYWWDGRKALYRLGEDSEETVDVYDPKDPEVVALWELLMPRVEAFSELVTSYKPIDPGP